MAEPAKVHVGAGMNDAGDAAVTLDFGSGVAVLDIYAALAIVDLVEKKIGQAINWHKLAHDPHPPELLRMAAQGSA